MTRKGGTGNCCNDCSEIASTCSCAGCLPQALCAIIEITDAPELDCAQFSWGRLFHNCADDTFAGVALGPGVAPITVTAQVEERNGECCFVVTLTTAEESLEFQQCGVNYNTSLLSSFTIKYGPYPTEYITGILDVGGVAGTSNSGQYSNLETGECAKCAHIPLIPRGAQAEPPVDPCDRTLISIATKTAARRLDLNDPALFDNEFCWFLAPCKCIPLEVCLTYYSISECEVSLTRTPLILENCVYGPLSIDIDRGYQGIDTVVIKGELTSECEIHWTATSSFGVGDVLKSLTRIDKTGNRDFSKLCDVTLTETEIPGTDLVTPGIPDTFLVTDECLCLSPSDNLCSLACPQIRMPPLVDSDGNPNTTPEDCFLVVLTAEIIGSCDFAGLQFEMHARGYEAPPNVGDSPLTVTEPACQTYDVYNPVSLLYETDSIDCLTQSYEIPPLVGDVNHLFARFTLYYPDICNEDATVPPAPNGYRLIYDLTSICGDQAVPGNTTNGSGTLSPTSSSCGPFELIFDVPFESVPGCDCSCSSFQLKITL